MMMHHESEHDHGRLPEDLAAIDAALDQLGEMERDATPASLADRIVARTGGTLGTGPAPRPAVLARLGPARFRLAAAAAIALVGAVAALWLATLGRGPGSDAAIAEADVDLELELLLVAYEPVVVEAADVTDLADQLSELEGRVDTMWSEEPWLGQEDAL